MVVDASLLVRLASRGQWVERIDGKLDEWASASEALHAPDLLPYELESALRSLVFARELTEAQAIEGLDRIGAVPLTLQLTPKQKRPAGQPCCEPVVYPDVDRRQAESLAKVAKALGDPIRLQLVDVLRKHAGKVCVC